MNRSIIPAALTALMLSSCGSTTGAETSSSVTTTPISTTPITTAMTTPVTTVGAEPNEGGAAEQVWRPGEFDSASSAHFSGTVRLRPNGCWAIEINGQDRLVAFPPSFSGADPTRFTGPDGMSVIDGTEIDATGQVLWIEAVPGSFDSRWGNLLTYCEPGAVEIAVLDHLEPAFDPTAWSESDAVEALRTAVFTESWPCGFGFVASTADQRVGLMLYGNGDPAGDQTITLPDERWNAEVVIGKHLFVQHCDDAVEQWEPDAVFSARWPIVAGQFTFTAPDVAEGCGADQVSTQITDGIVSTPTGEIELPTIEVTNTAWGCFAG